MKKQIVPKLYYKPEEIDELKEALNLLPDMVEHPAFPFGSEDLFTQIAAMVSNVYEKVYPE